MKWVSKVGDWARRHFYVRRHKWAERSCVPVFSLNTCAVRSDPEALSIRLIEPPRSVDNITRKQFIAGANRPNPPKSGGDEMRDERATNSGRVTRK